VSEAQRSKTTGKELSTNDVTILPYEGWCGISINVVAYSSVGALVLAPKSSKR